MKPLLNEKTARIVIALWYLVGIAGFLIGPLRPLFQSLTPFGMLAAAVLLFSFHEPQNRKSLIMFVSIAILGFIAEVIGVNTQRLFGNYAYGPALGLKVLNTPLVIGLNWLALVYCISDLLKNFRDHWFFPLAGAAIMVIFDWLMEPVAVATGMWNWCCEGVTLKNYIDWFLISAFLFVMIRILKVEISNRIAVFLLIIQAIFFLALNLLIRTAIWVY